MTRSTKQDNQKSNPTLKTTSIAVIGMGSIFPQARTTQQYWDNILHKLDCITDVPDSRWSVEDYYDPDPSVPDKTYCKRGGFIPDVDFDPMEFGLPPNILEVTDVSQLLSLVVAKDALEDAGYGEDREFDREHVGCVLGFVGTSSKLFTPLMTRLQYPVWEKVLHSAGVSDSDTQKIIEKIKLAYVGWEENSFPGAIGNVVSGRVCNRFDLGGLNCVVDAACASSLAAIKMAVGELIEGRAYMMLTGGIDTDNSINSYMCFSKTPAFTRKENVRTFDAESGGMMVGEGLGMVLLKRLEDAERDGDRIYAVIKAIGTSSDGRFKSIYAPRPAGQARALRRAYAEAGFSPDSVGMIEAHGTGTMAGDPAEFQGMNEVFGENNPRKQHIALGSVKSQIAHTKAAAGVASLIKTSLALYHKILPPTINVTRPNPKFSIEQSPFYINTEARPWIRAQSAPPRRAGVSSFGFGGTNYHVVLEEHTAEHSGAYRVTTVAQPILLSAPDAAQLLTRCREAQASLRGEHANVAFSQLTGESRSVLVPASEARVGFVAETPEEAAQALQVCVETLTAKPDEENWEHPKGVYFRKNGMEIQGKVVALFSGQGSQYLEMGRELANNFPLMREVFGAVDEHFIQDGLEPLSARVYPRPVFEAGEREQLANTLTRTEHAQPAIGAVSVGLYRLLQQAGFAADFTAGHSFGELTALWAAGVVDEADYYTLAKARGKAMSPPRDGDFDAGTMVAVKGDVEAIREALKNDPEVTLANHNANDQVVIAGSKTAMERAQQVLCGMGFKTIPLPVSAAFHTPLVKHAQEPFAKVIKSLRFRKPAVRVFSNGTAQAYPENPQMIQDMLAKHILNPVLFRDEIENIYAAGGRIFVEFGPKNVLTNLVCSILSGRPHLVVALNASPKKDSDRQLREAVIALRVAGLPLTGFDPYAAPRKVAPARKKSPVTVKLNGGYYVSEKTRTAFEKSLNDGFKISLPAGSQPAVGNQPAVDVPLAAESLPVAINQPVKIAQPLSVSPAAGAAIQQEEVHMNTVDPSTMEYILAEYQTRQSETLGLHEQYLRMEEEYARAFTRMTQLQSDLVARLSAAPGEMQAVLPLFESLERSMTRFHDHQAETLRVHQRYMESQELYSETFLQGVRSTSGSAPVRVPAVTPTAPVRVQPAVKQEPAAPVKPANGNGSAAHYTAPVVLPTFVPAPVVAAPAPAAPAKPAARPQVAAITAHPVIAPAAAVSQTALKDALLEIVSEKTGYPSETLELDMDMEADLGIDSIKRVEILGAMQTRFPELPQVEASLLAELRTLGQIVSQFQASAPAAAPAPAVYQAAPAASPAAAAAPASAPSAPAAASLTTALLEIVSEKTGYPAETLELDMDMEADLGIDSIKRVEILGAMQVRFPELPQIDAASLAELRTLGQIVASMGASSPTQPEVAAQAAEQSAPTNGSAVDATAATPIADDLPQTTANVEILTKALLEIVSEKTGYPAETLELDMNMEADLGIDSIKRVEILGAMQARFPDLPQVDAVQMAELCTLGQIVQALGSTAAPSMEVAVQSPFDGGQEEEAVSINTFDSGIEQGVVIRRILPPPDQIEFSLPANHICLLTDDGSETTPALVAELLAKKWPVVVLRLPGLPSSNSTALPEGVPAVVLHEVSDTAIETLLAQVSAQYGPVAVFIHLVVSGEVLDGEVEFSDFEKTLLKVAFLAAKYLKVPLNEAAQLGRAVFMTASRMDGAFGLSDEGSFTPISGGIFGLVKTLNLEWEAVFCRALDLSPELSTEEVVRCIISEMHDPNRLIAEVGYTLDERSTLAIASVPVTGGKK